MRSGLTIYLSLLSPRPLPRPACSLISGLRMGLYDFCKNTVLKVNPYAQEGTFGTKLSAGMASGMIGAAVANPADLVEESHCAHSISADP